MALQTGVGLSRVLILVGAGYTTTILMKNGKFPETLAQIQALMGGNGHQNSDADLTSQLRRLATEVQRIGSTQRITVLNGNDSIGNVTALIIPVATVGALGYGYMWWKGLSFSDLMYVTKKSMATAVTNLTKHLEHVSDALAAAKKHLTERIQGLNDRMDKQEDMSKSIKQEVATACGALQGVDLDLKKLKSLVSNLDGKIGSLEYKQHVAVAGVTYLVHFVNGNGNKMNMPKLLQDHLSGKPRLSLPKAEEGLKALGLADIAPTIDRSTSDSVVSDRIGNLEDKGRTLFRAASTKC